MAGRGRSVAAAVLGLGMGMATVVGPAGPAAGQTGGAPTASTDLNLAVTEPVPDELSFAVSNLGPDPTADPVRLDVFLPSNRAFAFVIEGAGWECDASTSPVSCAREEPLVNGDTTTLRMAVQPVCGVEPITAGSAFVTVVTDADFDDNRASVPLGRRGTEGQADLSIGSAQDGSIVVTNEGPAEAAGPITINASLIDELFVSFSGDGWDCGTTDPAHAVCTHPAGLGVGASSRVRFETVDDPNTEEHCGTDLAAGVSSPTPDPIRTNNFLLNLACTGGEIGTTPEDPGNPLLATGAGAGGGGGGGGGSTADLAVGGARDRELTRIALLLIVAGGGLVLLAPVIGGPGAVPIAPPSPPVAAPTVPTVAPRPVVRLRRRTQPIRENL